MQAISLTIFLTQHVQHVEQDAIVAMIGDIATAIKQIAVSIDKGALTGNMGNLASENVQGETQKALDMITNDIFVDCVQKSGYVDGMVSEEIESPIAVAAKHKRKGGYLLMFDPLDGSSNVNVNISVGTIFSILKSPNQSPQIDDFLQVGNNQVCAGYALYGTSTMLVFTTGNGVNGFTLDVDSGEFYLTHPLMQIPQQTQEFAANMSNYRFWQSPIQQYVDECLMGAEGEREKDFNMRWVASMVAEVHRILVRGGVFLYPVDTKNKSGKLRLMYEANPMSFIVEQAGGSATTGLLPIMDVNPTNIHQRVPVILGCKAEVDLIASYHSVKKKKR